VTPDGEKGIHADPQLGTFPNVHFSMHLHRIQPVLSRVKLRAHNIDELDLRVAFRLLAVMFDFARAERAETVKVDDEVFHTSFIGIGQRIALDLLPYRKRDGWQGRGVPLNGLCVIVCASRPASPVGRRVNSGAQDDLKLEMGYRKLIVGQQSGPTHSHVIYFGAICTSEITEHEHTIGPRQNTMLFGHAFVI
jgi:hypothetical protein